MIVDQSSHNELMNFR